MGIPGPRILLRKLCGAVLLLVPLGLPAQTAPPKKGPAPPPTGLKILSTTIDPTTQDITDQSGNITKVRHVSVQVQNKTNKTVVAYALLFHEFDKDGKEIHPGGAGSGIDHTGPVNYPNETRQFIQPGQIGSIGNYDVGPGTVRAEATIIGVVYEDRTWEGEWAQIFFITRARRATETWQALDLLQSYPATPEETRETMRAMLALHLPHVTGVIANTLHLGATLPDSDHPPEQVSRKQWEDIKTELERQAAWYEAPAQPPFPP